MTASVVSATMAACVVGAAVSSTNTGATVLKVPGNSGTAENWQTFLKIFSFRKIYAKILGR